MRICICRLCALVIAGVLDVILGDPHMSWHPICLIGRLIGAVQTATRRWFPATKRTERAAGVLLVAVVVSVSTAVPLALTACAYRLHICAGVLCEGVLLFFTFAAHSLGTESMAVATAFDSGGLDASRQAVSMIVGRDTAQLDEAGVIRAAVETVAENTSDGVIAPLFYALVGGAPLAYAYKAVNTMDSMVGYRNERYRYYGTAAARLDDLVNLLPSRLSAWLMLAAALPVGLYWRAQGFTRARMCEAVRVYRRDRRAHDSPNSAQTESVMAGVLGVQLAGAASYFGRLHEKPTIGDIQRAVVWADIRRSVQLMWATACLGWLLALAVCAAAVLM